MPWSFSTTVDHMVLFSGDGDFRYLVEALQRRGRKVTVISTTRTNPPMIVDDLRRQADNFIELTSMKNEIGRDPSEKPHYDTESEDDDYDDDD